MVADILSLLDYQKVGTVDNLLLEDCELYDAALVEVADYSQRQPNNKVVITRGMITSHRSGTRRKSIFSESIAIIDNAHVILSAVMSAKYSKYFCYLLFASLSVLLE